MLPGHWALSTGPGPWALVHWSQGPCPLVPGPLVPGLGPWSTGPRVLVQWFQALGPCPLVPGPFGACGGFPPHMGPKRLMRSLLGAKSTPKGPHGPWGPGFFRSSPARPPELAKKNLGAHGAPDGPVFFFGFCQSLYFQRFWPWPAPLCIKGCPVLCASMLT